MRAAAAAYAAEPGWLDARCAGEKTVCDQRLCSLKFGLAGIGNQPVPTDEKTAAYKKQCVDAFDFCNGHTDVQGAIKDECKSRGIDL